MLLSLILRMIQSKQWEVVLPTFHLHAHIATLNEVLRCLRKIAQTLDTFPFGCEIIKVIWVGKRSSKPATTCKRYACKQWRNEPNYLGGTIFARERSDQARGSVATERGEGVGVPPPTVGSFFIFRLENVQSGAYLRRKFRRDDMYYMGKRVTIRPTGKRVFF